ncbi:MAG: serine/threonine protein kinase [Planctomycetota bacterium]
MPAKTKLTTIGHYEVIRVLGKGGMGTVYLCNDPLLDRSVAIKMLNNKDHQESETTRRLRFIREAMITAQLQHPGIPPVYAISPMESQDAYYVMKPIEGRSLQEILDLLRDNEDGSGLSDEYDLFRMVEIFRDVCNTIRYAHTKGFLHRDIKPSNIFAGDWGGVYVIDWGLAKSIKSGRGSEKSGEDSRSNKTEEKSEDTAKPNDGAKGKRDTVDLSAISVTDETVTQEYNAKGQEGSPDLPDTPFDSRSELTMEGDVLGTIAYMPPEQAEGSVDELGRQADIYALGVILYEILTHELPVSGRTLKDVVDQKTRGEIEPPELRAPQKDIPPELSAITM